MSPPDHQELAAKLMEFAIHVVDLAENLPDTAAGRFVGGRLLSCGTSPAVSVAQAEATPGAMQAALVALCETGVWLELLSRRSMISPRSKMETLLTECAELVALLRAASGESA